MIRLILFLALACCAQAQTLNPGNSFYVAGLLKPAAGGGSELSSALVAWWEMEQADGANRTDSTGNGHTMTNHGNVTQLGSPKNGTWCAHTGGTAFLDNGDATFKGTGDFTMAGWVKGLGVDAGWVWSRYASGQICWYVYVNGTAAKLYVRNSANTAEYSATSTINITTAGWHHIVAGHSGTTGFIQVDNETRVTVSTDGLRDTTAALTIADLEGGTTAATSVEWDAIGFWNVDLSTADVTTLQTTFYPF